MDVNAAAPAPARASPVARDVHAIQRDAPYPQPMQHRSRHMARHGVGRQPFQGSADVQGVPGLRDVGRLTHEVGASAQPAELARTHQAPHLVVGEAGGEQPRAEPHVAIHDTSVR